MPFIGNQPAESYASFERQVFTIVNSQTAYTLSHSVVNENDIRLVVNNVVQEPGSGKAYIASSTTLTLSAALVNGTDEMYCVYLGRALQTVNPPNASVGNSQTAPTIITGQTAETSIATDDTILIHDTSASALRKMTRANFVSGIGGTNTPAFEAYLSSTQSISDNTTTKVNIDTENFDTNSDFASNRFTPTVAGKYFIYGSTVGYAGAVTDIVSSQAMIYKNGSYHAGGEENYNGNFIQRSYNTVSTIVDMNGSSDYVELYGYVNGNSGGGESFYVQAGLAKCNLFGGYKIIE